VASTFSLSNRTQPRVVYTALVPALAYRPTISISISISISIPIHTSTSSSYRQSNLQHATRTATLSAQSTILPFNFL
jgi:hypothetical protein